MYCTAVESRTPSTEDLPERPQLEGRAPQFQSTAPSSSENGSPTPTYSPDNSSSTTSTLSAVPLSTGTSSGIPSSTSATSHPSISEESGTKVKSTLEYIFLIVALLLFGSSYFEGKDDIDTARGCEFTHLLRDLRRRGLPLAAFFAFTRSSHPSRESGSDISDQTRSFPRTTGLPRITLTNGYPIHPRDAVIRGIPVAYTPHRTGRRTHGPDIGIGGRRTAGIDVDLDHDGTLSDKDVLPAYEAFGGPPKYDDVEIQRTLSQSFDTINSDSYQSWASASSASETGSHTDTSPPGLVSVEPAWSHPPMTDQAPTPTAAVRNGDAITTHHTSA